MKWVDLMLSVITTHKNKGHKETFGSDRYVYCLDCGNGFTGVCMSPNSSNYKIKYV